MSTLSVSETYSDGNTLTAAELTTAFTSVETWANGNVDSTNISVGGIATANLAANCVTNAKMAANAIDTTQIVDSAVTTAKIADANVTTSKLADASVTQAKRAALGQQISTSCGNHAGNNTTSYAAVTNLSVTITTTGRPVYLTLVPDGSGTSGIELTTLAGGTSGVTGYYQFYRGVTGLGEQRIGGASNNIGANFDMFIPVGSLNQIDIPSAGTYTYYLYAKSDGNYAFVNYAKLLAFEL